MPPTSKLFVTTLMALSALTGTASAAAWPRVAGQGTDWVNSLTEPQWPAIAGEPAGSGTGGPQWPAVGNEIERRFPSPWAFEIGARYWYSTGTTKFGFTNNIYPYGSPTSTAMSTATT